MSTFSDRIERAIHLEEEGTVFPHLEIWHSFPGEAQLDERLKNGMFAEEAVELSACGEIRFSLAEMPSKMTRTEEPLICGNCLKKSEFSLHEFSENARHIRDAAHALKDQQQNH